MTKNQVLSKTRKKEVVKARLIIMYLCKYVGGYSSNITGAMLGGRKERTLQHGISMVDKAYHRSERMRGKGDFSSEEAFMNAATQMQPKEGKICLLVQSVGYAVVT